MNNCSTIWRRIYGVILIFIFTMGITPTVVFHNLLANHRDETIQHHHTHTQELATASMNCHWDSVVCEGSFLNNISYIIMATPIYAELNYSAYYHSFYSQHHFYAELRGPPANIIA